MTDERPIELSAAGAARRERMLCGLLGEMEHLHRRRRRRRRALGAAGGAALLVIAALAARAGLEGTRTAPPLIAGDGGAEIITQPPVRPARVVFEVVRTDPDIVERYRSARLVSAEIMSDDALLAALREIDRPAGLIRMGDEVRLTRPVTDAAPNSS